MTPDATDPTLDDASFLDRLSPDERDHLDSIGTRRQYPPGVSIYCAGDPADGVFVLLDGEVKAVATALDGREVILTLLGPGSLLGEISTLDQGDRSATVQSLGLVEVLTIPFDRFQDFLLDRPRVLQSIARVVASRLRDSSRRQLEFGANDSLGRVSARLIEMSERYGTTSEDGLTRIDSPLSQTELASWSGLSREAVVKSLRALRTLGWIHNEGASITIVEPEQLRRRALS